MSWSTIEYGNYWAHAHDAEQVLFMRLAPECLDSSLEFREVSWLQEWKTYWLEHREAYVNGCSDIDLPRFLNSPERVVQFRRFLSAYKSWLLQFAPEISAEQIKKQMAAQDPNRKLVRPCPVQWPQNFAAKIEDVLNGNLQDPAVQSKDAEIAQQTPAADAGNPRG